ncbi:MAG: amidohydrolase family protein [Armatimonadetes bacterium]|nr:amidohydrolase family protein [Armatimonadota bacterium]
MQSLVLFDCNARIGTWANPRPEHFTDVDGLLRAMDQAAIDQALVHHAWAVYWDAAEGNRALLQEIAGQDRLAPCLAVLPPATGEMNAREIAATCRELRGAARAFPTSHQWRLNPWCAEKLLSALADARVPLFVEMSETNLDDVAATLAAFPELPLVLLNIGYRSDRYLYPLWEKGYNLMVGLETYEAFMAVDDVVARFGAERLLFATGLPTVDPGAPIALIAYAAASHEDKQKIAAGNLRKLLGR